MDRATRLECKVGGVKVVIRDWTGKFLVIGVWKKEGIRTALDVELLAVLEGLHLASNLGVRYVMVESNSTQAISTITLGVCRRLASWRMTMCKWRPPSPQHSLCTSQGHAMG